LFIFDEPTTGLHFHDIQKLLDALNALVDRGHTVVVIEHNMEIIKSADWIVDLGPDGGKAGGELIFEGTPEDLVKCSGSHTGEYLAKVLT
jgi:excinuclease ABC subunit A